MLQEWRSIIESVIVNQRKKKHTMRKRRSIVLGASVVERTPSTTTLPKRRSMRFWNDEPVCQEIRYKSERRTRLPITVCVTGGSSGRGSGVFRRLFGKGKSFWKW